jgi:hypothetical protein
MRRQITTALSSTILGVTCLMGLPSTALAVDGVILIDQNRAIAGNVTPGDLPGFPVTISQPGSYRLAGNLTVSDANTTAIEITADNVTLDLNGFTISGITHCGLSGANVLSCAPTGSGNGIKSQGGRSITVTNGTVQGMGAVGIFLNGTIFSRVENVRVTENGHGGIGLSTTSAVNGNTVSQNGGPGILVGGGSTVVNNTVTFNSGVGLDLSSPTTGYAFNLLFENNNGGSQVAGGIQMGSNVCNNGLCL